MIVFYLLSFFCIQSLSYGTAFEMHSQQHYYTQVQDCLEHYYNFVL